MLLFCNKSLFSETLLSLFSHKACTVVLQYMHYNHYMSITTDFIISSFSYVLLNLHLICCRQRLWMGPSQCQTSNSTATLRHSTSTVMCGTVCSTGSRRRLRWPWPHAILCRAETLIVRKRRSTASLPSNCRRYKCEDETLRAFKKAQYQDLQGVQNY